MSPARRPDTAALGRRAEQAALEHLVGQGLRPIDRNFRCRAGELDLVMRDGDTVVFVEVRFRTRRDFGGALDSIDHAKRARIARAAARFLQREPRLREQPCRFDVVAARPDGDGLSLEWIRGAFEA